MKGYGAKLKGLGTMCSNWGGVSWKLAGWLEIEGNLPCLYSFFRLPFGRLFALLCSWIFIFS